MPPLPSDSSHVDVVGVGINATDTVIRLPHFPSLDSKVEIVERKAGGQVASAMVACSRWGLRVRYIGKIGDDDAGEFQKKEMAHEQVDARWILAPAQSSQTSFIIVDQVSGERTVLWKRDPSIAILPSDLNKNFIQGAKALLVDGHDTAASATAARWAHEEGIFVTGDFDNLYPGVEDVLQYTDYPIVSKEFPERLTGESSLLKSLPKILEMFKGRLTAATLGRFGVLAWTGTEFILSPGFKVHALDTTGAGDIFHGGFLYGMSQSWDLRKILEFANAAAALNCKSVGARGNIASLQEIDQLRRTGSRYEAIFNDKELLEATTAGGIAGTGLQQTSEGLHH